MRGGWPTGEAWSLAPVAFLRRLLDADGLDD